MQNMILVLKGFLIGIANIIPGVSGGTLMITLGIYERIINAISHFFHDFKENIKFLVPLGIGMVLSILLMSQLIGMCLEKFPFPTTLFFVGLILGGIPLLWRKVKDSPKKVSYGIIFVITFLFVAMFAFLKSGDYVVSFEDMNIMSYVLLFGVGMIASATMIIPGISGSFMLMLLGYYKPIIDTLRGLTEFSLLGHNLAILIPFGIGVLVGIVLVAKLIEFLLKKFEIPTYYGVLGFVLASMIAIILPLIGTMITIWQVLCAILLFAFGFGVAYKLGGE